MADQAEGAAGIHARLQQLSGILVIGQILHWTVATWIEDEVIIFLIDVGQVHRVIERYAQFCEVIFLCLTHVVWQYLQAVLVYDRSLRTRGGEVDIPACALEDAVRCNKLLGPIAGGALSAIGQCPFLSSGNNKKYGRHVILL